MASGLLKDDYFSMITSVSGGVRAAEGRPLLNDNLLLPQVASGLLKDDYFSMITSVSGGVRVAEGRLLLNDNFCLRWRQGC